MHHNLLRAKPLDILHAAPVVAREQPKRADRSRHRGAVRVHNCEVKTALHSHCEERGVYKLAVRQTERNVRHTEHVFQPEFLVNHTNCLERFGSSVLFGGGGKREAVDIDIALRYPVKLRALEDFLGDFKAFLGGFRNSVLVKRQPDYSRAVLFHERQNRIEFFVLAVDRVDDRLARNGSESGFEYIKLGCVDLKRRVGNRLNCVNRREHHFLFIDIGQPDIHVEDFRAAVALFNSLPHYIIEVVPLERFLEELFAGGIYAFADNSHGIDFDNL